MGIGWLGGIPEEGALFRPFVNRGHPGVLLVGSSFPSVWCGDPRAWPMEGSRRPSVVKMSSVFSDTGYPKWIGQLQSLIRHWIKDQSFTMLTSNTD